MTGSNLEDAQSSMMHTVTDLKTRLQISQDKSKTREQTIAKLTALLSIAFEKATKARTKGGARLQQKWFALSASIAHTLARLVSDLEYEKLRLDIDELEKKFQERNVASQRIRVHNPTDGPSP